MVYPPAPWKSHNFGAYYLKQTKLAKIIPNFKAAQTLLKSNDIGEICDVLDNLSSTKWRVNKRVLEMIEYIWSIGGGVADIPKKFNDQPVTESSVRNAEDTK